MGSGRLKRLSDKAHRSADHGSTVLEVSDLVIYYEPLRATDHPSYAVNGVSLTLIAGESLGLVGESGCGKTTLGMSVLRALPSNARIESGEIRLAGRDITDLSESQCNEYRWRDIAVVFQASMNILNPVRTVIAQIAEPMRVHNGLGRKESRKRAVDLLTQVGIDEQYFDCYPHEYSGGMLQRAVIAMALACGPAVVIADEPGTALDVVLRAQILDLLRSLQKERGLATLVISHDLATIKYLTNRCAVMYAGLVVEYGSTEDVLTNPQHPYTRVLVESYPEIDDPVREIPSIPGSPPSLEAIPRECPYVPRCGYATDECRAGVPALRRLGTEHYVRCVHAPFPLLAIPTVEASGGHRD